MPEVNHPFLSASWSPHEVVADERPVPTDTTLAIHPLSGAPLMNPYGKKMVSRYVSISKINLLHFDINSHHSLDCKGTWSMVWVHE
jgi:hypothetical protein